jgi:hypothetical protein
VGLGRKQQTGQNRHRFYVQVRRELGLIIFGFITKNPKIMFGFVTKIRKNMFGFVTKNVNSY